MDTFPVDKKKNARGFHLKSQFSSSNSKTQITAKITKSVLLSINLILIVIKRQKKKRKKKGKALSTIVMVQVSRCFLHYISTMNFPYKLCL